MKNMRKIIGGSLAVGICVGAAVGLLFAHINLYLSVGAAIIAIVFGSAIARQKSDASNAGCSGLK